jgi:hypothetical protein
MISKEQFPAILSLLVPQIVEEYMSRTGATQEIALEKIYSSKMYEFLSDEELKIWHFSPKQLCNMLFDELSRKENRI